MDEKNLLVSFVAIMSVLLLVATVSASEITNNPAVYIDSVNVGTTDVVSVVEGDTISVKVVFTADMDASDVKIKATIEGYRTDVEETTERFDVEDGMRYSKTLSLKIPYSLKDELSDDGTLDIKIYTKKDKTELDSTNLRIQRAPYKAEVMSISTFQTAEAGQLLPVDIVLKNKGYNDLDDIYVTIGIEELGIERTGYFGDLVALENDDDDDDEDTVSGRIYLQIPDEVEAGLYTLEVEATGEDITTTKTKQIAIENEFSGSNIFATVTGRSVAVGEDAEYNVLIVNPTSKLKVYRVVPEVSNELSVSADQSIVAVPAGSSRTAVITANGISEGTYNFNVNVYSGDALVSTVALSTNVQGRAVTSPIVILTVVLAIIFIVLLIVLFVLVGKKPEKSEEFGESYY